MYPSNRLFVLNTLTAAFLLTVSPGGLLPGETAATGTFRGSVAFEYTKQAVAYGERPSGSAANEKLRSWIAAQLKPTGAQVSIDSFAGRTPEGTVPMANVIAKFPGTSGKAIAITGHFDTKKIPGVRFLGANDAGSSTGFLLEFARALAKTKHKNDIYLVFFDGEEALHDWTETDSCYGSRHLAAKWLADGMLSHLVALINVDMIGDKDLDLLDDSNSSPYLRTMVRDAANRLGYAKHFRQDAGAIEDDHQPFAQVGVNVLDLIDFDYGPNQSYWHTEKDTIDKLSANSLQVVGDVVLELTKNLDSK